LEENTTKCARFVQADHPQQSSTTACFMVLRARETRRATKDGKSGVFGLRVSVDDVLLCEISIHPQPTIAKGRSGGRVALWTLTGWRFHGPRNVPNRSRTMGTRSLPRPAREPIPTLADAGGKKLMR
jgi:hypothetical protein